VEPAASALAGLNPLVHPLAVVSQPSISFPLSPAIFIVVLFAALSVQH
jgi:hypothetical protein